MKVYKDIEVNEFEFWGGAKQNVEELTDEQLAMIWEGLEETAAEPMTETDINDFFWFDTDTMAWWLGYEDWDEFLESPDHKPAEE